jgi:hypothetical protein
VRTDSGALAKLIGAALTVERQLVGGEALVELDLRIGPQRVERDRDRADRRHVEPRVGLAPVLHEREIRARTRTRGPLRSIHGS